MATQVFAAQTMRLGFDRHAEQVAERNLSLLAAQQRAKRGPTPEAFFVKHLDNSRLVKTDDPVRVREMRIFTAAMTVLFLFLMVYGWQHFSAIEYGYHVEAAKQQRDLLEEQNRQLRLTEAELCDPGRIDRMARKLGLNAPQPGQVVRPDSSFDRNAPVVAEASPMPPGLR
ncbi:MAG TPA: cell division protein FtsL [Acidobacteriaceae bacterium]|nr:cell division protein FtsL [Acidobacteriaceae bacterium]